MFRYLFLISLTLTSSLLHASQTPLLQEFLLKSHSMKMNQIDKSQAENQFQIFQTNMPWQLSTYLQKEKNDLAALSTFFPSEDRSTKGLSIRKQFRTGTILGISLSDTNQSLYEYQQGVTITQNIGQNFFGRIDRKNSEEAMHLKSLAELQASQNREGILADFYQTLLTFSLHTHLLKKQMDSLSRAKQRALLVQRRVREGLAEEVEKLEVELSVFGQEDLILETKLLIDKYKVLVEQKLGREVSLNEFDELLLIQNSTRQITPATFEKNKNLLLLEKKRQMRETQRSRAKMAIFPNIELTLGYKSNNVAGRDESFSPNYLNNREHTALSGGVILSMPLGFSSEKSIALVQRIESQRVDAELEDLKRTLQKEADRLTKEEELLQMKKKSAADRLRLATALAKETQSLYSKGRAELEQLLRSEEGLISSEMSLLSIDYSLELNHMALALFQGELEQYLGLK